MPRLNPTAIERLNLCAVVAPINSPVETDARSASERHRRRARWRQSRDARLTAFRISHGLPATMTAKEVTASMRAEHSPCP